MTTNTIDLTALIDNITDQQMIHLPLASIIIRDGFNPRRYFAKDKMAELVESIKAQGVIQPIIVKPSDDKTVFHLIAGERRFRAASVASDDDNSTIPVIVRLVNDEEAISMALSENSERQDVSIGEEAKAVHRMMGLLKGDKDQVALSLGWNIRKVNARLLLLNCTDSVLNALEERKISAGHAELLAGLVAEIQDKSIAGIIANKITVSALKESLSGYAYSLSDAVFDTSLCNGCPNNSSSTSDLFDESLNSGQCMARDCYNQKTQEHLTATKENLKDKYPVVWLDVEKPSDTRCFLVRDGDNGVGKEQFSACQGCAKFGALLNTTKGNEGNIEESVCFDTKCNKSMVKKNIKDTTPKTDTTEPVADKTEMASAKPTEKTTKAKSVETPRKVMDFVEAIHREAIRIEVAKNDDLVNVYALIALAKAIGTYTENETLKKRVKELKAESLLEMHDASAKILELSELEPTVLRELTCLYSSELATIDTPETIKTALIVANAPLEDYFTVTKSYLETLTIAGLDALLDESGFAAWYDSKDDNSKCKQDIQKGNRAEQIDAVIDAGFEWKGFIPSTASLAK